MTKIRVKKSGKIGYMLAVLPMLGRRGGCGKRSLVMYAVDPKSIPNNPNALNSRYVIETALMKDVEIMETFEWEKTKDTKNIPTKGKKRADGKSTKKLSTRKPAAKKKTIKKSTVLNDRFKASKEFAMLAPVRTNTINTKKYVKKVGK